MPNATRNLIDSYIESLRRIYGDHLKQVILYGSYARGDNRPDSDIDIMLLLDLTDMEIKEYFHDLSDITFDYLMDYDLDISPIAIDMAHFSKWVDCYPFYNNVRKEGVILYDAA